MSKPSVPTFRLPTAAERKELVNELGLELVYHASGRFVCSVCPWGREPSAKAYLDIDQVGKPRDYLEVGA